MTSLDSAIASLLASRTEILLSAIRPSNGAATGQTTAQANTFQFAIDTPLASPAVSLATPLAAAGPSAQTALSTVARTLDVISRLGGGVAPILTSSAPLWPTAPRPPLAASAFASITGTLFDALLTPPDGPDAAFAANAAAALAPPAPPLPSSVLASALAKTVDQSGLFYESHLVQWLAGQRTAASLAAEPQARLEPPSALSGSNAPDDGFLDVPSIDIPAIDVATAHAPTAADPHPVALPQNAQQAAALAESVKDMPASVFSNAPGQTGQASAGAGSVSPRESAVQASIAAGIHPATIALVRQQLDVLATDQFRWSGEVWPGARMDWDIAPQEREARTADHPADAERPWRTRITLTLPTLGTVDADLILTGQQLVARVKASANGVTRLVRDGDAFREQLDAAGLKLTGLTIRPIDGGASAEAIKLQAAQSYSAQAKPVASPLAHLFGARAGSADDGVKS